MKLSDTPEMAAERGGRTYRQCTLKRGRFLQIAWIPSRFACLGAVLRLRDEDGWEVVSAGRESVEESYVLAHRDDYRNSFGSLDWK